MLLWSWVVHYPIRRAASLVRPAWSRELHDIPLIRLALHDGDNLEPIQMIGQSALVLRRVQVWRNEERLFSLNNMAASADVMEMRAAIEQVLAE